jgi:uncharacterized OB-fold protein
MSSLVDRFRSGAGKATFEADKLRRVTAIQANVRSLRGDFQKELSRVGQIAFNIYRAGQVEQPELKEACDRLEAIQAQINAQEQEIERIRAEQFVPEMAAGPQYGRVCPNGHGALPPQDNFCQTCGAQPIFVQPPAAPAAQALACQHCGTALSPGARFCAGCGQAVAPVAPPPEPPKGESCPDCAAVLLPDALFCAECGYRLEQEAASVEPLVAAAVAESQPTETETAALEEPITEFEQVEAVPAEFEIEPESVELVEEIVIDDEPAVDDLVADDTAVEALAAAEEDEELTETSEAEIPVELEEEVAEEPPAEVAEAIEEDEEAIEQPAAQEARCPECDAALLSDAIFCAECGHALDQPAWAPDEPAPDKPAADKPAEEESAAEEPPDEPADPLPDEPAICANCSAVLLPDSMFCAECGQRIE